MTPLFTSKRRFVRENFFFFVLFCLGFFVMVFGIKCELSHYSVLEYFLNKYKYTVLYEAILLIMSFLWYCFILPYKLSLKSKTYIQPSHKMSDYQSHKMGDYITVEVIMFILYFVVNVLNFAFFPFILVISDYGRNFSSSIYLLLMCYFVFLVKYRVKQYKTIFIPNYYLQYETKV